MKNNPQVIYLISGQGADDRLFKNFNLDPSFDIKHVSFELPEAGSSMQGYARQLSAQIDRNQPIILIGVSIGGMLAVELTEILYPEKTIIISSSKCRSEIPLRYRIFRTIPVHKAIPGIVLKRFARLLQPVVEPDQNKYKETFKRMLLAKDPRFLKHTINMIINWNRSVIPDKIVHIHGNRDNTIPIKNVKYDYLIEGGSHMMALTKGTEISALINDILAEANHKKSQA